jgi:hypothetical protein
LLSKAVVWTNFETPCPENIFDGTAYRCHAEACEGGSYLSRPCSSLFGKAGNMAYINNGYKK